MNATGRYSLAPAAVIGALVVAGGALLFSLVPGNGRAQEPAKRTKPASATPVPQQPRIVMPEAEKVVLLVRTTLLTLNDALLTGNFTVLRDVAAPGFSQANSAARLATIFSNIAKKGVDLTAVAIITPQLTETPVIDQKNKMLRIKGFFPGHPVRINFDAIYQAVAGRWRLFGLSVQPANVAATAGLLPSTPAKALHKAREAEARKPRPAKK